MVDGTVDADRLLPTLCVQWLLTLFPQIITYKWCCKVQPTCKEARIGTNPCLLAVEIAVRITGWHRASKL